MARRIKYNPTIFIFTSEQFPYGYASTNRIISYARGFIAHHKEVMVICFRKTETKEDMKNKSVEGIYRDIHFKYLSNSNIKIDSFYKKQLYALLMNINLFFFSLVNLNKSTFSIYYSSHTTSALILKITSWLKGSILLKEENEHPSIRVEARSFIPTYIFKKIHYSLFDGLLLMTNNLITHFRNDLHSKKPLLHVKMTVDIERFQIADIERKKTITYCGILNDAKDGIDILIDAFARIAGLFPEYRLLLIGTGFTKTDHQKYIQMVSELNLSDKVIFSGDVSNDLVPRYLMESSILVLARPDSLQAQQGFPTKLGEYLATGNPVITTSVGEIPIYLKDGVNAFIALPGNVDSLTAKLTEVLKNQKGADEIGLNGRKTTLEYFNNITQTKEILDFYQKIKDRKC
jgi:glycosyltransferase involved in cell wall biosynthesis